MDSVEIKNLQSQESNNSQDDKIKQLHDQLQADIDKLYEQAANRHEEEENKQTNIFNCEIEFPEEWTQVDLIEIKNGLKLDWIVEEQRNLCKQYLLCSHCQNVLWNPKKCKKCKKHSCQKCFEQIQKCPLCPELPDNKLVMKDPEDFCKRQLCDLKVFCPFQKRGCRIIVEYSKFEEHVNECNFRRDDQNLKYKQISIVSFRYKQLQALQKSHILYTIETHIKDVKKQSKVERRYKQFEILHQYFSQSEEYLGMPLPTLPPKTFCLQSLFGSSSDQISEEEIALLRMTELETYLQILGYYYKDDKILNEFLTNEEGFNYLNQNKQKIWSLQYLIQQYNSIKHYSSNYVDKLISKGINAQQNDHEDESNNIQKSEILKEQLSLLNNYKVCFSELKKTLLHQINDISQQIKQQENDLQKLSQYQGESLINEFIKKLKDEQEQQNAQQKQMQKTLKQLQIHHKYIESIENCGQALDSRQNEYQILKKTLQAFQIQEKDFKEKKECQDIIKSMEIIQQESVKFHELAEKESKKIIERLDKELPIILKMIQDCYYNNN